MKSKIILLILLASLLFGCKKDEIIFNSECYPENLRSGVIASYSFKNGSLENGTTFDADLVNNGAFAAPDRNGNPNCAYEFDTDPSFPTLSTSHSSFLNGLKQFSISLWYQPLDSTINGGGIEELIGRNKSQDRCPDRIGEWSVGLHDCRRVVFGHNNSVWEDVPLPPPPNSCLKLLYSLTGSWHHVVAVYNHDKYKIYKDGIIQDTISGPAVCSDLHLAEDTGELIIGYKFTGRIDDILIYNREISPSEVLALFENEPCCQP